MGFRYPICNQDFGNRKEAFIAHTETAHLGMAHMIMDTLKEEMENL